VANPTPSKADITVTKAVAKAAALFDIAMHDHPIIGCGARTYAESTSKLSSTLPSARKVHASCSVSKYRRLPSDLQTGCAWQTA
jgi:hypothetical protein